MRHWPYLTEVLKGKYDCLGPIQYAYFNETLPNDVVCFEQPEADLL